MVRSCTKQRCGRAPLFLRRFARLDATPWGSPALPRADLEGRVLAEGRQQEWRGRAALLCALQGLEADVRRRFLSPLWLCWRPELPQLPSAGFGPWYAALTRSLCPPPAGTSGSPRSASASSTRRASASKRRSSRRSARATPLSARRSRLPRPRARRAPWRMDRRWGVLLAARAGGGRAGAPSAGAMERRCVRLRVSQPLTLLTTRGGCRRTST